MADMTIPSSWISGARYKKLYQFVSSMNELKAEDPSLSPKQRLDTLVARAKTTREKEELKATFRMLKAAGMEDCKKQDIKAQMQAYGPTALKDAEDKEKAKKDSEKEVATAKKQLSDCRKQLWGGRFLRLGIVALATLAVAGLFFAAPVILGSALSAIGGAASFGAALGTGVVLGVGGYYLFKLGSGIVSRVFKKASGLINEARAEMAPRKKKLKEAIKNSAEKQMEYEDAKSAYDSLESDLNDMEIDEKDRTDAEVFYDAREADLIADPAKATEYSEAKARYQEMVQDAQTIGEINEAKAWFEKKTNNIPTKTDLQAVEEIYKANETEIKLLKMTDASGKKYKYKADISSTERAEAIRLLTAEQSKIEAMFKKDPATGAIDFTDISKFSKTKIDKVAGIEKVSKAAPADRETKAGKGAETIYNSVAGSSELEAYIASEAKRVFVGTTTNIESDIKKMVHSVKRGLITVKRDDNGKIVSCDAIDDKLFKATISKPSRKAVAKFIVENPDPSKTVAACSTAAKHIIATDVSAIDTVTSGLYKGKIGEIFIKDASLTSSTEKLLTGADSIAAQSADPRFVIEAELRSRFVCNSDKNKEEFERVIECAVQDAQGKTLGTDDYTKVLSKAVAKISDVSRPVSADERKAFQTALQGKDIDYRGLYSNGVMLDGLDSKRQYLANVMFASYLTRSTKEPAEQVLKRVADRANGIDKPAEPSGLKVHEWKQKTPKVRERKEKDSKLTQKTKKDYDKAGTEAEEELGRSA